MGTATIKIQYPVSGPSLVKTVGELSDRDMPDVVLTWNHGAQQWESDWNVKHIMPESKLDHIHRWTGDDVMRVYGRALNIDEETVQKLVRSLLDANLFVSYWKVAKTGEANITLIVDEMTQVLADRIASILNRYPIQVHLRIAISHGIGQDS